MSKWRYTLVGWLMWRLWKRRIRSKLAMQRPSRVRRWAVVGVGVLALALVFERVRRTLGWSGDQHRGFREHEFGLLDHR